MHLTVIGPGSLGLALAQWAAECGLQVTLMGRNRLHAEEGRRKVLTRWEGSLRKGRLSEDGIQSAASRLQTGELGPGYRGAVLEALPEDLDQKAVLWRTLAEGAGPETLWLTATSSLPLAEIRRASSFPLPIFGFHCFVPLHLHRVLELISEPDSDPSPAHRLGETLGLKVIPAPDRPGFLASRLALLQGLEAIRMVERGEGSPEAIDALMTLGYGHPCGPLELSDRVGLDLRLAITEALHRSSGDPAFAPPDLLKRMVGRGELGMKAGRGFYVWQHGRRKV
nr:3-hydroxyacyl-CoA dehydrogenase family protein [uncultured Holophaga sp.]